MHLVAVPDSDGGQRVRSAQVRGVLEVVRFVVVLPRRGAQGDEHRQEDVQRTHREQREQGATAPPAHPTPGAKPMAPLHSVALVPGASCRSGTTPARVMSARTGVPGWAAIPLPARSVWLRSVAMRT